MKKGEWENGKWTRWIQASAPPRPTLGDSVVLRDEHQSATGPLKPGDVGEVVKDDGSSRPLWVSFGGRTGFYRPTELRVADLGSGKVGFLLQQVFDATKKLKSTVDRKGPVPDGFTVVQVNQLFLPCWEDLYMQQVKQVLSSRGRKLDSSPCSTVRTQGAAAALVASADQNPLSPNAEALLLHGTKPDAVTSILSSRFDREKCEFGLAGRGFYFAERITKADEYTIESNGLCCVIVCRVLLGHVNVCADANWSRDKNQSLEDSVCKTGDYDSVMVDRERSRDTFREFVVYDTAAVPSALCGLVQEMDPWSEGLPVDAMDCAPLL
eukprot:CAMPEP_0204309338 /NCGR_PEP_ID=MMETSP0469-20131031/1043_1 /ASSEMBLY_ACC=CAM_ASM_000384 /TAXON_ID=2969 /ORGANISM="Oxyrrhis marina" /LENGTH=323 /DNA_ID=CAMNT_0051288949 /DNA_START=3 /DNA_END=969 /DNA_ORIENTATION=+